MKLLSFKLHNGRRLYDINQAIEFNEKNGHKIPKAWVCEKQSLDAFFNGLDNKPKSKRS